MATAPSPSLPSYARRPVWPALLIVVLGVVCWLLPIIWQPFADQLQIAQIVYTIVFMGPMACLALLGVWWLAWGPTSFRVRWVSTLAAILLAVIGIAVADPTIQVLASMWGIPLSVGAATAAAGLLLAWAPFTIRAYGAALIGILAFTPWLINRLDGVTGAFELDLAYRWSPTAEQIAAAYAANEKPAAAAATAVNVPTDCGSEDWPGFRGPEQEGIADSPAEVKGTPADWPIRWRRPIGPAWSSCCIVGDLVITQEQREEEEWISAYLAKNGELVWKHAESTRYSDFASGPGPRGTPSFAAGKVYAFGATGRLVCLEAATGKHVWTADLKETLKITGPEFGFATSPLVHGGKVYVHPGSSGGPQLVIYDAETGKQIATQGEGTTAYSSPHLASLGGVDQVLVFDCHGLTAREPQTGAELWKYTWEIDAPNAPCIQPLVLENGDIILGSGGVGYGTIRIRPALADGKWTAERLWHCKTFSPGFNDVIRFGTRIYGLGGGILTCVDLDSGERLWKNGRYGAGQLFALNGRLLVISETGELIEIDTAAPKGAELGKAQILKDKTWNHPAFGHGCLYLRNAQEIVCLEVAKEG